MRIKDLTEKEYFKTTLYEMSNFFSDDTGLSKNTKLWLRTEPVTLPHIKYRIKIDNPQKGSAVFAIWGDTAEQVQGNWKVTGKDLQKIQLLVALTKDHLRAHIDGLESSAMISKVFDQIKNQVEMI